MVFGKASGFAATLDLSTLKGCNGFRLDGIDPEDRSGFSVASAGDVNGDGFDDILVGAYGGDPGGEVMPGKPMSCSAGLGLLRRRSILSTLNGSNGFRLDGIDAK